MRVALQAWMALALSLSGCGQADAPEDLARAEPQAEESVAEGAASSRGARKLSRGEAVPYITAEATALIDNWRPLAFTGELKPYDPNDLPNKITHRLFSDACKDNEIWRETRTFEVPMGQVPTAIGTTHGPVLYQQVWEKGVWHERLIYVGVRVRDRACGALDRKPSGVDIRGDGDVLAVLVAAGAIREMDREADGRKLTSKQRADAREFIPAMFSSTGAGTSQSAELPMYSSAEFRRMVQGRTKKEVLALLGRPLSVWGDRAGGQVYDYSSDATYLGQVPFRVTDETTGLVFRSVQVVFGPHGRALRVNL